MLSESDLDSEAVDHFKQYLRLPSVQPDVDYSGCVEFLSGLASGAGLPLEVVEVAPDTPVLIVTWLGSQPQLPSLLLSSHMDVVPVFPESWTYPPFSAHEDEAGNIFARGTQDMKCVGIQYLEAIRRLILQNYRPQRTIHVCFTPDEEIGSQGMKMFVKTQAFKKLNVGCALDEGVASPEEAYYLFNGERTMYVVRIDCPGCEGHGSIPISPTAGEKLSIAIQKFMEKRAEEINKLANDRNLTMGDVTNINLTMVEGGIQPNVLPPMLSATFDCRVGLNTDHDEFEAWVEDLCKEAGEGVMASYLDKKERVEPTILDDNNPWWVALKDQFEKLNLKVRTSIFPASTDARYIRGLGIPAFGFSPINNTPILAHKTDEFLNVAVFLKGIEIYMKIIPALADI